MARARAVAPGPGGARVYLLGSSVVSHQMLQNRGSENPSLGPTGTVKRLLGLHCLALYISRPKP